MHGGEGRAARDAFVALKLVDQAAVVSFLKTLQVLPPGTALTITEDQLAAGTTITSGGAPLWVTILGWSVALLALIALVILALRRRQPETSPAAAT